MHETAIKASSDRVKPFLVSQRERERAGRERKRERAGRESGAERVSSMIQLDRRRPQHSHPFAKKPQTYVSSKIAKWKTRKWVDGWVA